MVEPTGSEQVRAGARNWSVECPNGPKSLSDTKIRDIGMSLLSRNLGKIENEPGITVRQHQPGSDLNPTLEFGDEAVLSVPNLASLPLEEAQDHIIGMLDAVRRQGEAYHVNKPRWMLIARKYRLSHADIAVVLGMTEGGVRQAIKRAKDSTPDELI